MGDSLIEEVQYELNLIKAEIEKEPFQGVLESFNLDKALNHQNYNPEISKVLLQYLDQLENHYLDRFNLSVQKKEKLIHFYENADSYDYDLNDFKNKYYNESLADLVRNVTVKDRIIEHEGQLIQQVDPIFNETVYPSNLLDYRAHFFAPKKHFLGTQIDTFYFNMLIIWLMCLVLYLTLYTESLKKALTFFSAIKFRK